MKKYMNTNKMNGNENLRSKVSFLLLFWIIFSLIFFNNDIFFFFRLSLIFVLKIKRWYLNDTKRE